VRQIRTRIRQVRETNPRFRATRLKTLLLLVGLAALSGASRTYAEDVLAGVRACEAEQDDARRLACYDNQLHRAPSQPQKTAAPLQPPLPIAAASTAPVLTPEQQFGMSEELARKQSGTPAPPRLEKLQARIAGISRKPRGEPIVRLENGQVWETVDGEGSIELKVGDVVTIWPGLLGAFRLSAGNAIVRVHRVQ
jgi:hypothetical protein